MIVSEKSYQNQSDYIKFLFKINSNIIKKVIISDEKMRNSGNSNHNYAHSFFEKKF